MQERYFHLRLECDYAGDENDIQDLALAVYSEGQWESVDLDIRSPGFLLMINGLFSCQHLYMRTNAAECGIQLASSIGELRVRTTEDWQITDASVDFRVKIRSGDPTERDLAYITERMHHCPVSTNLKDDIEVQNTVFFEN